MNRFPWLVLLALVALATLPACRNDDDAPPIDTELVAYLSEARAFHHVANLAEDGGDLEKAANALDRLVAARRPHPERKAAEIEEVLADAYARLAELRLKDALKDVKRKGSAASLVSADDAVARGLEHAPEPTYFRGHLLEVRGLLEESRAATFADAGKPQDSKQASDKAVHLFEEVVKIQDQVIQRSLQSKEAGR